MTKFHILTIAELVNLKPLIEECIEELGFKERTSSAYIGNGMATSILSGSGHVMADDREKPKSFAWGSASQSAALNERYYHCNWIYTGKEHRGSKDLAEGLVATIEDAARFSGCKWVAGGCWKLGDKSSEQMWTKAGYIEQESYFTKQL